MILWQYFPKSKALPNHLNDVINVFEEQKGKYSSDTHELRSNDVLEILRVGFEKIGYRVEKGKSEIDKVNVPVLFGENGKLEKSFDADCYSIQERSVIEIEAGRAVTNYQFLKDLFQASMMYEVDYLTIAVRRVYKSNNDYKNVITFLNTLFASQRIVLPLKGILIIGY
jgi:hypothetical protein